MESPVNKQLLPIAAVFALLDFQANNPELYENKTDGNQDDDNTIDAKVDANTITRWAVRDDGRMIVATTSDAFPDFDKTTERLEGINIGKNLNGDDVFLATIQDSGKQIDFDTVAGNMYAELEAKSFKLVLPEPGSHFGTSAHADKSFTNIGLIYVLDKDGKLKEAMLIKGMKKAFLAGAFDGKITVAIETDNRFGILDAMMFVDRARNGAQLVQDAEGKAKEEGETLTRAELDEMMSVMAVKNGKVAYYDEDGNQLEKTDEQGADIIKFPGVDSRGQQTLAQRVKVTRTGETSGTVERIAVGQ